MLEVTLEHYSDIGDSLHFTWECTELVEDLMILQLYFENPTFVSTQEEPDVLSLTFYDNSFFEGDTRWPMWPMHPNKKQVPR